MNTGGVKDFFENTDNVFAVIGLRKDAEIVFYFQGNAMRFKPGVDRFWRELMHSGREKFSSTRVLC